MKNLHKGEISLSSFGNVVVSGGSYPSVTVNEEDIAKPISKALCLNGDNYETARFIGRVTLVIECLEEQPEIKNTIFGQPDPITAVPMSLEESVKVLSEIPNEK